MLIVKRIYSNIFWFSVNELISRVLIFVGTIYLARILGREGFGLFSVALAVGMHFLPVVDIGVPEYGTREVARDVNKTSELYSVLNSIRFFLAVSILLSSIVGMYFSGLPFREKLIFIAGVLYPLSWSLSPDWVFRGLEKMRYIMIGGLASSLVFLTGTLLLVKSNTEADAIKASFIYSLSFLVGSLILIFVLYRKFNIFLKFNISFKKKWIVHVKESIYFCIKNIFGQLGIYIPVLFLWIWYSPEHIGSFSAPHRVSIIFVQTTGYIIMAVYPILSNLYVEDKTIFERTISNLQRTIMVLIAPLCVFAIIFSKEIILIIFGSGYVEGAGIFRILILFSVLMIMRTIYAYGLSSAGYQRYNMNAAGIGLFISILTGIFLIKRYNVWGAAWALLCGEFFAILMMVWFFKNKARVHLNLLPFTIKLIIALIIMMIVVMQNQNLTPLLNIVIGLMIYGIMLFITGVIRKRDVQFIYQSVKGYLEHE